MENKNKKRTNISISINEVKKPCDKSTEKTDKTDNVKQEVCVISIGENNTHIVNNGVLNIDMR